MIHFIVSVVMALSIILLIGFAAGMAVYNREHIEKEGRE